MGMYDRVMHLEEPSLPAHCLSAALYEVAATQKTAADLVTAFGLSASETTELTTLLATITGNLAAKAQRIAEIHFVLMLAEQRVFYPTAAALKTRLGV